MLEASQILFLLSLEAQVVRPRFFELSLDDCKGKGFLHSTIIYPTQFSGLDSKYSIG